MNTLTDIDEHLFTFFHDFNNIIGYSSMYPKLQEFKQKAEQYLENKSYSDINVQDEKGNTLLHLAFKNITVDNMTYILDLLLQGADPFIKNNNNATVFQVGQKSIVEKFWRIIDDVSLQDFYVLTNGYNKNLKQSIFEEKHAYFETLEEITTFLEKNDLLSQNNISHLLCKSSNILCRHRIELFLTFDRTPEDNTFFLSKFINVNALVALEVSTNSFQIAEKNALLSFVSQNDFTYNNDFISFITNDKLLHYFKPNKNSEVAQEVLYHVIQNTPTEKVNLHQPIFIKKAIGQQETSLFEILQAHYHMYNIFMEKKLNMVVPNKESTISHKKKI